jgi:hypothetical protein
VFYCNPEQSDRDLCRRAATREFLAKVTRESPETTILVDEAYYDYVTDPDHDTHIPIAVDNPRVIVARTFSKAYGMAGLRMGYAVGHPDTIKKMAEWDGGSGTGSLNVLALHAGIAAIQQDGSFTAGERARNKEVRDFTMKWFADRGMKPTDAQANFMFVNIGRPAKAFRDACRAKGVLVARDFPAVREDALPAVVRHDGRDEEGGGRVRAGPRAQEHGCGLSAGRPRVVITDARLRRRLVLIVSLVLAGLLTHGTYAGSGDDNHTTSRSRIRLPSTSISRPVEQLRGVRAVDR